MSQVGSGSIHEKDKALLDDFSLVFTALGRFYLRVLDEVLVARGRAPLGPTR
jgi:hypothetical protein